jgi:hypothetical protein
LPFYASPRCIRCWCTVLGTLPLLLLTYGMGATRRSLRWSLVADGRARERALGHAYSVAHGGAPRPWASALGLAPLARAGSCRRSRRRRSAWRARPRAPRAESPLLRSRWRSRGAPLRIPTSPPGRAVAAAHALCAHHVVERARHHHAHRDLPKVRRIGGVVSHAAPIEAHLAFLHAHDVPRLRNSMPLPLALLSMMPHASGSPFQIELIMCMA